MSDGKGLSTCSFPPIDGDAWECVAAPEAGWDAGRLDAALDFAGETNAAAMLVVARGRILAERYWQGWDLHTASMVASVQKSVTSLLIARAREERNIDLADPVSRHLGIGWSCAGSDAEGLITLRHLLTMTSGLDEQLRPVAEPGSAWYYNTPAYYRLKGVIERASGMDLAQYSAERLFAPIGMRDTSWQGEMFAPPPGQQLHASARDMARFGLLVLNRGAWDGAPILRDSTYLDEALSSSQALNPAYGYLWWLNGNERYLLPRPGNGGSGSLVPAAPNDLLCAWGAGDKKIYVVPSLDLVVVRHGGSAGIEREQERSSFDNQLWERLMTAAPG